MIHININNTVTEPKVLPFCGRTMDGGEYSVNTQYFMRNGRPILPIMGEFHFSRYHLEEWEEAILKMRSGGIEIIATYVFWIHHEEKEGEWDFNGCRNLRAFLDLCRSHNMPVWLRIGPWVHGEARNGGFPDWVVQSKDMRPRTNDQFYLEAVSKFFEKIAEQSEGMMYKDGGPVIGIQIENEFGHCGGTSDKAEGMEHIGILKNMAVDLGLITPYYTATGWGGAYVLEGETLPVLGGYVDAPWAEHINEMPANENFLFCEYKNDTNIGSDLKLKKEEDYTYDINNNPYLTAELGAGLQVTAHRRTVPFPQDIEAQTICMLGSGANLIGYYMYHGGFNPEGKYSTLQESKATGYNNDLPVKSYDFQTCIRQSGEINKSYGRLKKIHLLLQDFGGILAPARPFFPIEQPDSAEDMTTPRVSVRYNKDNKTGFVFINNHQRLRYMDDIEDLNIDICQEDGIFQLNSLYVKSGECAIIPYHLHMGNTILDYTNASLLCKIKDRYFFYTDERSIFKFKGSEGNYIVLSNKQANSSYKFNNSLYITDSILIDQNDKRYLISQKETEKVLVYRNTGVPQEYEVKFETVDVKVTYKKVQDNNDYIIIDVLLQDIPHRNVHELLLAVNFVGDRAELYQNNKLIDDWFTTGEEWHIALKRFNFPKKLQLKIYQSKEDVYYDMPVMKGCYLQNLKAIPVYKAELNECNSNGEF